MGSVQPGGSAQSALDSLSPVDTLKLEAELANRKRYTPQEAKANLTQTLTDLAYSTPAVGNALSLRDAMGAKAQAKELRAQGDEEAARRAEARAAVATIGGFIPGAGGLVAPTEGAALRAGIFVPAGEGKADLARALWRNMPRNYKQGTSPEALRQSVFKESGVVMGPEGAPRQWVLAEGMGAPHMGKVGETLPLGAVVEHPALFEAQPWVADIPVHFRSATPEGGKAQRYAPFARTNPQTGDIEVSTNMKPEQLRAQLAKLASYRIGEAAGFAAPGRHLLSENLGALENAQEAVRQNLLSPNPTEGALPYFERLTKIRDKIDAAIEAARRDPESHPWLKGIGEPGLPLTANEARKAISTSVANRMGGNVDAYLARNRALHGDVPYPYEGVNLPELFVLPQAGALSDPERLAEFIRNWREFGQGAQRGRK